MNTQTHNNTFIQNFLILALPLICIYLTLFPQIDAASNAVFTVGLEILFCSLAFLFFKKTPAISKKNKTITLILIGSISVSLAIAYLGHYWHYSKLIRYLQIVVCIPFIYYATVIIQLTKRPEIIFIAICTPSIFICFNQFQYLIKHWQEGNHYQFRTYYFEHSRHLGHYLLICLTIFLSTLSFSKQKTIHLLSVALALTCWIMLFWLGGRLSIAIGVLQSLIIISLLFTRKVDSRTLKTITLLSVPLIAFILSTYVLNITPSRLAGNEMLEKTLNPNNSNTLSSGRTQMWENAFNLFRENIVFGAGPDAYAHNIASYGLHAHGIIPQILCEFGLLGGGIILVTAAYWTITTFLKIYQDSQSNNNFVTNTAYLCLLTLLLNSLLSGTYYFSLPVFYISLFVSIILGTRLPNKSLYQSEFKCSPLKL